MEKTNKRKRAFLYSMGVFGVIVLAVILTFYSMSGEYEDVGLFSHADEVVTLSDGWTLTTSKGSFNISLPSKETKYSNDETVVLTNTLPDVIGADCALMIRTSLQGIKAYVDGELIYSYGDLSKHRFGKNNGSIWNIITLDEEHAGKTLELEITSPYVTYRNTFNTCYMGTHQSVIGVLKQKYAVGYTITFVIFVIGIALLVFYVFTRISGISASDRILMVSLLAIFSSIWLFTECKLTQMLVGNMAGISSVNFMIMAVMIIPFVIYVDMLQRYANHRIFATLVVAHEINVVIQTVLQLTGVCDYYEMMYVTHSLIAISSVIALVTSISIAWKKKDKLLIPFLLTTVVLSVGAILEIAMTYITGVVASGILEFAVLFLVVCTGLDSIKEAEQLMQDSRRAMEENAAKNTFLANVSHELRTPMNAIFAMSDLLAKSDDLSKGHREMAEVIHSSADNLLEVINDILDFSKVSGGHYVIDDEVYSLTDIICNLKNMISVKTIEKGLDYKVEVSPDIHYRLSGDETKIRQILLNLLGNAVKYTPQGSVTLKIYETPMKNSKVMLSFEVTDTGVGIKREDMDTLFKPFVRGDGEQTKLNEGTGLGLAISKELAERMGGTITVRSEYGKGSTFICTICQRVCSELTYGTAISEYFKVSGDKVFVEESGEEFSNDVKELLKLGHVAYTSIKSGEALYYGFGDEPSILLADHTTSPFVFSEEFHAMNPEVRVFTVAGSLDNVDIADSCTILRRPLSLCNLMALRNPTKDYAAIVSFEAPNANVMVVDDNVVNLKVMKEILGRFKIKPMLISCGTQAVAALRVRKCDLIFMDHMMPEMDGIETAKAMREMEDIDVEHIKIVALTANATPGIDKVFESAGFNGYIQKPISIESVSKVLARYLPSDLIQYR